jgi:raffinose/stachyose/melibiose transport system substrate-binding protein
VSMLAGQSTPQQMIDEANKAGAKG